VLLGQVTRDQAAEDAGSIISKGWNRR
jgi:hypothetical protein